MNEGLLKDLCCPETGQPLHLAPAEVLAALNDRIRSRELRNRAGRLLAEPCEGGCLREDGRALYPVRSGVPILLIAESIPVG